MPATLFCCGGKCGVAIAGAAPGVNGVRHWATVVVTGGTPTISLTGGRDGGPCLEFPATSGAASYLGNPVAGGVGFGVARFYFKFVGSLPAADMKIFSFVPAAGSLCDVRFQVATSDIRARVGATNGATGVAIVADQWYRIDCKAVVNGATRTMDVQVDGVACGQASAAVAASSISTFRVGRNVDTTTSTGGLLRVTDLAISGTSADYPLGAGKVVGLYPNGDGAHNFSAAGDFKYDNLTNVPIGATDTYLHVSDSLLDSIAAFISVNTASNIEYLEWLLGDLGSDVGSINGAQVTMASHSSGTGANKQTLRLNDGGTLNDVCTDLDQSNTTITYHSKHYSAAPSGGAWTKVKVDALRLRWNSSYGAVDVSAVPFVDGICVEVDYVPAGTAYTLPAATGAFALTGIAAAKKLSFASATGSFASAGNAATQDQTRASSPGAFVLTGNDAVLILTEGGTTDFVLIAASGTFTLTGNAAALKAARKLAAATGAFLLDGKAAGLLAARRMTGAPGVFALTGNAAGLLAARKLVAETGVFVLSGNNAALLKSGSLNLVLIAATGVFALSGKAATLRPFSPFSYHTPEDDTQIYVRDVTADTTLITASATGALLTDAPIKRDTVITPVTASPPGSQFTPV